MICTTLQGKIKAMFRSKELYFRECYMIIGNAEVEEIILNMNILTFFFNTPTLAHMEIMLQHFSLHHNKVRIKKNTSCIKIINFDNNYILKVISIKLASQGCNK